MITEKEIVNKMLNILNEAFESDPSAIHSLICMDVPCNEKLADHPTIIVRENLVLDPRHYTVGLLGIINGFLSTISNEKIAVKFDDNQKCLGFQIYK